ncbi:MAG: hypothetical protein HOP25_05930 [Methylotenera sp.]|nr:hypothetical protein [Methylotenera sp.]
MECKKDILSANSAVREAAICLQKFLSVHPPQNNRAYEILQFLANETIKRIDEGKDYRFNNKAIKASVLGDSDSNSGISTQWNKLIDKILPEREEGFEIFAREHGLAYYAWLDKLEGGGSGNQALYFIVAKEVRTVAKASFPKADITYIPTVNVSPSWWAKWLFNENNLAVGWRKKIYVFYPMIPIVLSLLFFLAIWLVSVDKKTPISAQDVTSFTFMLAMFFYCKFILKNWLRLVEDRIVMAPDNLLSSTERDVSLELVSSRDEGNENKTKVLRLVKYASQCPICQAEILLDKGEPDFPRRIVGRCKESPREHVYSFDRITLTGNKLR